MHKVNGIGGIFFIATDPQKIADWYSRMLGVDQPPATYDTPPWRQAAGPTVFAPMDAGASFFATPGGGWAINFRVDDLDAMVEQLRHQGVEVDIDPETYPNGRFASLRDPEGNAVQLWQVAGVDA
jgi:glyoxylase I family protein